MADLPKLEIPELECAEVILPTPANFTNFFGGLATLPAKLLALAENMAEEERDKFLKQAKDLQKVLDDIREFFSPYDPKLKKLSIPEKEWEIMIQRLLEEYPMYIQSKIMELIGVLFPLEVSLPMLGLNIDVVKLVTDREYLNQLQADIAGFGADVEAQIAALGDDLSAEELQKQIDKLRNAKLDSLYDLLPDEYKYFDGEYGLENQELKAKQIMDFIKNEATKFMNGQLFSGFGGLIGIFDEIWSALGLPALPVPLTGPDVGAMIKAIIDAEKAKMNAELAKLGDIPNQIDKDKLLRDMHKGIISQLEDLEILGFKISSLLGGDFTESTEALDFKIARISAKLKEFRENWQTYLLKKWMEKVTAFFDAIGLSALTQWITFTFCDFLKLIGIPTTVDLSSFGNITTIKETVAGLESQIPETSG